MGLDISKITSGKVAQTVCNGANKAANAIGGAIEKSSHKDVFDKAFKAVEPTGVNNSFIALAGTMGLGVLAPRVATALKRNPDDKEATKDEITDILFRDVQTILIMLFALKSVNSVAAGLTTKFSGLPMTDKPYQKIFNDTEKGLKGIQNKAQEFVQAPAQKLKAIGKNILDTLHPTGGIAATTNEKFISDYSRYNSMDQVNKLFESLPDRGGNTKKVYDKIIDSLIQDQETVLNGNVKKGIKGLVQKAQMLANKNGEIPAPTQKELDNAKNILEELKALKGKDFTAFNDSQTSDAVKNLVVSFFKDENNALTTSAKGLNAVLRTGALTFEALYLGLGLPALNQKRLKKKYLGNDAAPQQTQQAAPVTDKLVLSNKNVSDKEVKIYSQFIK